MLDGITYTQTLEVEQRFDRFVVMTSMVEHDGSPCWEWQGSKRDGYGVFTYNVDGRKRTTGAHRVSYERWVGPIPDGLHIDHLCRNRGCVSPLHIEAVTQAENNRRAPGVISTVNAAKTHCIRGHEFTPDNTGTVRRPSGGRQCLECQRTTDRVKQRRWRAIRKAAAS